MKYETIYGRVVECDPPAKVAAYLAKLGELARDPSVSEPAFLAVAYAPENPLLDPGLMPGAGSVTAATVADPAYPVLQDLVYRKTLSSRGIDPAEVAATYTMTTADAAAALGLSEAAVRLAANTGRLGYWVRNGRYHFHPKTVERFEPERRGPKAEGRELKVVHGSQDGFVLKVKADRPVQQVGRAGNVVHSVLPAGWSHAIVLIVDKERARERALVLVPAASPFDFQYPPFSVEGHARILERVNNPSKARQTWEAFGNT